MTRHRHDRDDEERAADVFGWIVIAVVFWASMIGLFLIATNRWPT